MTETAPSKAATRLAAGVSVIKEFQKNLTPSPGVYRMLNKRGEVLYVGKARNLRARVASYTRPTQLPIRLQRMISETNAMEFTSTQSEAEALLLEALLIKEHMPRYNILLRDDKSFPFIYISGDHNFPRIQKHRGARKAPGQYFGPYMTSGGAVDQTIASLQRAFLIRNCTDAMFANRSRPCLQYHIKRCSGPCVNYISQDDYAQNIQLAVDFLRGKHGLIQEQFAQTMVEASARQDYETAAQYRDRIRALTLIQTKQRVHVHGLGDMDVIAAAQNSGKTCVQIFTYRDDSHLGNHAYFPKHTEDQSLADIIAAFIVQFYQDKPVPDQILVSENLPEADLIARALAMKSGHKIEIQHQVRGKKKEVLDHAIQNAQKELERVLAARASQQDLLQQLAKRFGLPRTPLRVEIYDNSHIQGKNAVGAMVVAGLDGFNKKAYRHFTIRMDELQTTARQGGDDYAMLRHVLYRRFARLQSEDATDTSSIRPDLLLIDGGLGQLNIALQVLAEKQITDIPVIAIAKGPDRNAGRERFFMEGKDPISLPPNDPVLHFLQRLRDEAHRFVIGGHRKKRRPDLEKSELDRIGGIGASRKRALMHHFGSVLGIKRASLADLRVVKGISQSLAQKIYSHFHSGAD